MTARPDASDAEVSLREVTPENLDAVLALAVAPEQQGYVASNARSIAQAHFEPGAWYRVIYAGDAPAGFLMLHDENLCLEPRRDDSYSLWRLMIDRAHQGRGVGRRAIELLADHVRSRPNGRMLLTSCLPGPSTPEPFYLRCGFRRTGEVHDGEIELAREL